MQETVSAFLCIRVIGLCICLDSKKHFGNCRWFLNLVLRKKVLQRIFHHTPRRNKRLLVNSDFDVVA